MDSNKDIWKSRVDRVPADRLSDLRAKIVKNRDRTTVPAIKSIIGGLVDAIDDAIARQDARPSDFDTLGKALYTAPRFDPDSIKHGF